LRSRRRRRSSPGLATAVRIAAASGLAASIVVPLVRRRLRIPSSVTIAATVVGPVGLAVLRPRTKARDAALFGLQMWGFTMAHELPFDDPERLRARLRVRYPIPADRAIGAGTLPNVRLQRWFSAPGKATARDRVLALVHWAWFLEPHAALVWILVRHNERFARAARQMAATFDLGCAGYFAAPTAPPWWASEQGYTGDEEVRRIMVEVGEEFWGRAWPTLYESLGGNPWAAMPSLHFATSVLAAILLAETGPAAGAVGWGYALTLGFALVYLGEHYVIDLVAGAALVALVRRGEPLAEPMALRVSDLIQRLERVASA
jgi:membrane-associated phospholipid phosphatase